MDGRCVVINLDRDVDLLQRFLSDNGHVPGLRRFAAVDGRRLSRDDCIRDGLITTDNGYTLPALGCALSHVALWRDCAAGSQLLTICEDDAILHRHLLAGQARVIDTLPPDWDIVHWGWNIDWPMAMELVPSLPPCMVKFPDGARPDFARFPSGRFLPRAFPLRSSAGTLCYTLSPGGARRLLARCLPIGAAQAVWAEDPARGWDNTGVDVEMSRHYGALRSFVCVPPLAISPNAHAQSTIRGLPAAAAMPESAAALP
jgi:GR25 family glycosyltransferase involved in LPS biosynthesis